MEAAQQVIRARVKSVVTIRRKYTHTLCLLRVVYKAVNNYMFRPLYWQSSDCTLSCFKANHTIYIVSVITDEISFTFNTFSVIIIMFLKVQACFLFFDPQDEVGPSISSSVVLCFFVLLVYIVVLVLVVCVHPLYMQQPLFLVLFYFLYYVLCSSFFFCLIH